MIFYFFLYLKFDCFSRVAMFYCLHPLSESSYQLNLQDSNYPKCRRTLFRKDQVNHKAEESICSSEVNSSFEADEVYSLFSKGNVCSSYGGIVDICIYHAYLYFLLFFSRF